MDADKQEKLDELAVYEAERQAACNHKFKARYDIINSSLVEELASLAAKQGEVFNPYGLPWQSGERSLKEKRYIHDVCGKCGKVIKR
jgi:hypothetical protein